MLAGSRWTSNLRRRRSAIEGTVGAATSSPPILAGNKIGFHSVGDTRRLGDIGSIPRRPPSRTRWSSRIWPAPTAGDAPAFVFHLGDVIYNFGEAEYYYDQFYEPFRAYDRPIFAIPGNHDGEVTCMVRSPTSAGTPDRTSRALQAFIANMSAWHRPRRRTRAAWRARR